MSVKRESVDFDPLASLLTTTPPPSGVSSAASIAGESSRNDQPAPPPPPVVICPVMTPQHTLEAPYLSEQFLAECRLVPLASGAIPNNVTGMQMCAKVRAWKNVISISSHVLQGVSGLELVLKNNNSSERKYVLSLALQLRLEGLFRLKLFDELVEEISSTLTSLNGGAAVSAAAAAAAAATSSAADSIQLGIFKNASYCATLVQTDFNTQMTLNMLLLEVRLLTGRAEEAIEELFQLRKQLHVDLAMDLTGLDLLSFNILVYLHLPQVCLFAVRMPHVVFVCVMCCLVVPTLFRYG